MKIKKGKITKNAYLKGHEPKKLQFPSGRSLTTNGLTKQAWDPLKKGPLKKLSQKDKKAAQIILSL